MNNNMDHASVQPRRLAYHLLEEMTNGFSNELGSGTYGKVYLGVNRDGEEIAVKVFNAIQSFDDNDQQFDKEFHNLTCLQHPNIVRFIGYCHETHRECFDHNGTMILADLRKRALCFEYMHNGSLDNCLSDEFSGHDWHTRYAIIKGICEGLKYLHEELQPPMFHLDLKPANILLDKDMVPKLADFGLSRLFREERTQTTTSFMGTIGYLPPEFIKHHEISNKLDIFSLGVVIIKIMTGRPGYSKCCQMSSHEFIELVHENWRSRLQANSVRLLESFCEQVKRCIKIALNCLEDDRHQRPSIGEIISKLNEAETVIHERPNMGDIVDELNEIETMRQFPDVSSSAPGSSTDQSPSLTRPTDAMCRMLSSRSLQIANNQPQYWRWISLPDSRFAECAELLSVYFFAVIGEVPPRDLSPGTSYAVYLVYKLTSSTSGLRGCVQTASLRLYGERIVPGSTCKVSLDPEARGSASDVTYPVVRGDGWLELRLAEFANDEEMLMEKGVIVDLREENVSMQKRGLIVEGMEFRSN